MGGYYLQKWTGDGFVSFAWLKRKEDAEAYLARLLERGNWWGLPPRIVAVED